MRLNLLYMTLFLTLSMSHLSYGMAGEGDSTASKIQFNTFEAILSSRIIHFKWSVASEEDGHQFIIEKSLDQLDWYTVTKIASIKSHKEQHTYEISEIDFAEGVNEYFRVVRIDAFGEKTELDRVNINRPVLKNMLMIPVPRRVNKEVTISYDSMICSDGTLSVMREDGSIIQENQVGISEGYNRFQLNIKNFEPGNYLVFVKDEFGNKVSKRLVVHK